MIAIENSFPSTDEFQHQAPVVVFAYNRPDHLEKTLVALERCHGADQTEVYIFCDGPKAHSDKPSIMRSRKVAQQLWSFGKIHLHIRERNWGLSRSIVEGVTQVLQKHEKVIVLEDDIILANTGLIFFNTLLKAYHLDSRVMSIAGYAHPDMTNYLNETYKYDVVFDHRIQCWGWATWRDAWEKADFTLKDFDVFMKNKSMRDAYKHQIGADSLERLIATMNQERDLWACKWAYAHFRQNSLALVPTRSLVENIGLDGTGQNSSKSTVTVDLINTDSSWQLPPFPFVDQKNHERLMRIYGNYKRFSVAWCKKMIKSAINRIRG